jgi:hypothetical protein
VRRVSLCLLLLAVHLPLAARAAAAPLTLAEYLGELDRLAAFLRTASPADAEAMSAAIAPRWDVDTGPERVGVDVRWLVVGMREARLARDAWTTRREVLRRRLVELRAHAVEYADAAGPRPDLRTAVQDVLSRPEFQRQSGEGWLERLQEWIVDRIRALLNRLGVDGVAGRGLAVVLAWTVAIGALCALGVWLASALAAASRAVPVGLAQGQRRAVPASALARQAMGALRAGDIREAVRYAYGAALRRMEEQGVWRLEQSRTPREYLRLLPQEDSRRAAVRDLTELFEQVWYANRIGDRTAQRLSASLETLGCLHQGERAT